MSTTALVIEFFIIGIQAFIWLFMLILIVFGVEWIDFDLTKLLTPAIVILIAPICYPIGLFIDDLADLLSESWKKKIKAKYIDDNSMSGFKLLYLSQDDWLRKYFDYIRIRIRISRSSALNFTIISVIFPLLARYRLNDYFGSSTDLVCLLSFITFLSTTFLAIYAWASVTDNFYMRIKEGYSIYRFTQMLD